MYTRIRYYLLGNRSQSSVIRVIFEIAVYDIGIYTAQCMFAIQCKLHHSTMLDVKMLVSDIGCIGCIIYDNINILEYGNICMGGFFIDRICMG